MCEFRLCDPKKLVSAEEGVLEINGFCFVSVAREVHVRFVDSVLLTFHKVEVTGNYCSGFVGLRDVRGQLLPEGRPVVFVFVS